LPRPAIFYANGKFRVTNIPSVGSYELTTGAGQSQGDYIKSSWAYGCMMIRSTALSQIPWRLVRDADDEVVENHPLVPFLDQFEAAPTDTDLCTFGAAYWLMDGSVLRRLPASSMGVEASTTGIIAFKQKVLGAGTNREIRYKPKEIMYFREFHPADDLGPGVAPIDVARPAIKAEYESSRYIQSFFENDAIPGLLLHTEQVVPQSEMTKLETWWKNKFGGAAKHHKVAFVDKGLEAQVLSSNLGEMALEEVRDQARRDICTAFRVPMVLVGDLDASNFATAHEARLSLFQETIVPRTSYFEQIINKTIVEPSDPTVRFEFATDELEILQEDENAKAERIKGLVDGGIISKETARAELGYKESDAPAEDDEAELERTVDDMPPPLRSWRRKAMNALKAGKPADVPFDTPDLSPALVGAIRARLGQARTPADVTAIFRQW